MKKAFLFSILFVCFLSACKDEPSHKNIAPDQLEGPAQVLNDDDLQLLNKAKGKEIVVVSKERFFDFFSIQQDELSVLNFWDIKCESCPEQIKMLNDLYQEMDQSFNLMHIVLGSESEHESIKSFVRQNGIQGQVLALNVNSNDFKEISNGWTGDLPALLLWNLEEELNLFYQRSFTKEELTAILETVTR